MNRDMKDRQGLAGPRHHLKGQLHAQAPAELLHFIPEENLATRDGGKATWEYKYVEPVAGENAG